MSKQIRYRKYYVVEHLVTGQEMSATYPTDSTGQSLAWKEYRRLEKQTTSGLRLVCKSVIDEPTEDVIWI